YIEIIQEQKRFYISQTFKGKTFKVSSIICGIYCIYKILIVQNKNYQKQYIYQLLQSSYNYIVGRKKQLDPINKLLKNILPFIGIVVPEKQYDIVITYLSFSFLGYLMITNVRSFCFHLINMFQFFIGSIQQNHISTDIVVYCLAEVLGVYFISTLILIQNSVDQRYLYRKYY
ncbi:hypothetical protein IMG5_159720, partial [Ichthyophthirius multifiliis]